MTIPHRQEIHLNFEGTMMVDALGVDPGFVGRAIPAFTGLLEALCVEPDAEPGEDETVPVLLGRLNGGSSVFRMQEDDRMTPHGLSRFQEVVDCFVEDDPDETTEVLNGITGQSLNGLKRFLSVMLAAESTFRVEYNGETAEMDDLEEIRDALKLLRGLRKQETREEGVRVKFEGYLPQQKKAEFIRQDSTLIEVARVNPKARGFEDLIERIREDRVVSLVTRQSGDGKPSTTILAVEP